MPKKKCTEEPRERLNRAEKFRIKKLYNELDFVQYGSRQDPCLRVRKMKKYQKMNGKNLNHYRISYFHETNKFVIGSNNVISHVCGNATKRKHPTKRAKQISLCMNVDHMRIETNSQNRNRAKCHNFIRDYEQKYRLRPKDGYRIIGKLTVDDINEITNDNSFECKCQGDKCFINYGKITNDNA